MTALLEAMANNALLDCKPYIVEINKLYWNSTVEVIGAILLSTFFAFHPPVLLNRL